MLTINTNQLKAAIHCAAAKDVRFYLQGVHLEVCSNGDVHIVSTDGNVLFAGLICAPNAQWTDTPQKCPWSMILPLDVVKAAVKTKAPGVTLTAMPDGRYMLADRVFAPVDGKFPDWRRVIPSNHELDSCEAKPAQFNPDLLTAARDALNEWFGSKKPTGRFVRQRGEQAAVMTGDDMTAVCIVMPLREKTMLPDVRPFTPATLGA